ncbi:fimbrial protein [Citrobacter portucalensis]|uniref:fimbrial protein n=1 Tax=Citrobacter portucalensis TaxID=1639133 RepID=UPI00351D9AC4
MTKNCAVGTLLLLSLLTSKSYAELGAIPFRLYAALQDFACDVSLATANQTVHIGDFDIRDYTTPGSVSPAVDFSIDITNCDQSYLSSQVYFSGQSDDNDANLLKLSGDANGGDVASGIAVQILDSTLKEIPLNSRTDWTLMKKSSGVTLQYKLRYKSTIREVKGGNAAAVLYFDVLYQ